MKEECCKEVVVKSEKRLIIPDYALHLIDVLVVEEMMSLHVGRLILEFNSRKKTHKKLLIKDIDTGSMTVPENGRMTIPRLDILRSVLLPTRIYLN